MLLGVIAATLALSRWEAWSLHGPSALRTHRLSFALLLGIGFVAGELPNSFVKRQLDTEPGAHRDTRPSALSLRPLTKRILCPRSG